jgi:hypothetical protein
MCFLFRSRWLWTPVENWSRNITDGVPVEDQIDERKTMLDHQTFGEVCLAPGERSLFPRKEAEVALRIIFGNTRRPLEVRAIIG